MERGGSGGILFMLLERTLLASGSHEDLRGLPLLDWPLLPEELDCPSNSEPMVIVSLRLLGVLL